MKMDEQEKEELEYIIQTVQNPPPLIDNYVELRSSPIHGKGVFSTNCIEKDRIITYYPAHAIQKTINDHSVYLFTGSTFTPNHQYGLSLSDKYVLVGDNEQTDNTLLLGHMINDSAKVMIDLYNLDKIDLKISIMTYLFTTSKKSNCMFYSDENSVFSIKTIRNIEKDEELFVRYSALYWLSDEQKNVYKQILQEDVPFRNLVYSLL
jgi:SET domain-containing protein